MVAIARRQLGRTGLVVSEVGHGLWGMGSWSGSDDQRSAEALALSASLGCSFYDSAVTYGDGKSDSLAGRLLSGGDRSDLVVASKIPPINGNFPGRGITESFDQLFPLDYVIATCRRILEVMAIDTIPLLQFHVWDDSWTDSRGFAETIRSLKGRRLASHVGVSLNRWEPSNGVRVVESGLVDTVQVVYNIFNQAAEDVLFPACRRNNVGVIARVALDEGSLTGEMSPSTTFPPSDWRAGYFNPRNLQQTMGRVERLRESLPSGMSLTELAIRFVLSNMDVSTVVIGMRKEAHVRQNLSFSSRGSLPSSLVQELREHRWDRASLP